MDTFITPDRQAYEESTPLECRLQNARSATLVHEFKHAMRAEIGRFWRGKSQGAPLPFDEIERALNALITETRQLRGQDENPLRVVK